MSREIKYRAWDKKQSKYDNTNLSISMDGSWISNSMSRHLSYEKDDIIIEQFTGLTDKNGTEIYCGDIVLTNDCFICKKREIVFDLTNSAFMTKGLEHVKAATGKDVFGEIRSAKYLQGKCEIVGNIHE